MGNLIFDSRSLTTVSWGTALDEKLLVSQSINFLPFIEHEKSQEFAYLGGAEFSLIKETRYLWFTVYVAEEHFIKIVWTLHKLQTISIS
jgi:hypothetical protein